MKIFGLKYRALLSFITILLLIVDIFLMYFFGFERQLLIFLYIMIGIVPLCGIVALFSNMFVPKITIDYNFKTITSDFVANELYKNNKHLKNQGDIFYFKEITNCKTDNKKMFITLIEGKTKTLYLTFFTKRQIEKIKVEIDKIIFSCDD